MTTKPTKPKPSSMPRKKVNLALMANDTTRKASFAKCCKGLMKKITELTSVCHVPACTIIFAPHEHKPDVWPSMDGAMEVLRRFKSLPKMTQSKKMTKRERFLQEQVENVHEQLRRQERENDELRLKLLLHEDIDGRNHHTVGMQDIPGLLNLLEMEMKGLKEQIDMVKQYIAKSLEMAAATEVVENFLLDYAEIDDNKPIGGQEMIPKPNITNSCSNWRKTALLMAAAAEPKNYWLNFAKVVLQNQNCRVQDEYFPFDGKEMMQQPYVMDGRSMSAIASDVPVAHIPKENYWLNFAKEVLQNRNSGVTDEFKISDGLERMQKLYVMNHGRTLPPKGNDWLNFAKEVLQSQVCGWTEGSMTSGGHDISVSQVAVAAEPRAIDGHDVANEVQKVLNCGEANEFINSCRREMMQQPYHLDHGSTCIGTDSMYSEDHFSLCLCKY